MSLDNCKGRIGETLKIDRKWSNCKEEITKNYIQLNCQMRPNLDNRSDQIEFGFLQF